MSVIFVTLCSIQSGKYSSVRRTKKNLLVKYFGFFQRPFFRLVTQDANDRWTDVVAIKILGT